ncbi:MAG: hypothetical protein JWO59_2397 [Chloroflexi bacterium]|nr:hypothetical protein [Chloroflexota bacterium]
MNELAAFDLPESDPAALAAGTALDPLETATIETGQAMLRAALQAQWAVVDAQCVAMYCRQVPPGQLRRDRHRPITVASRLGTLQLRRQMLSHWDSGVRVRPGDQALPIRRGMVISRSLREWACLLTQDVSFATAARLLGWQTQEERILSPTTLCTLVRRHGAIVRIAEREAIGAYPYQAGGSLAPVPLVPYSTPKRRAGWPAVLSNAVEAALAR